MAIAPSKLGGFVAKHWQSDDTLLQQLRAEGLVSACALDDEVREMFIRARDEHASLSPGARHFNSPNERVRVFLAPLLSEKGTAWAVPLESLHPADDKDGSTDGVRARKWGETVESEPTARAIVIKTIITHTVTYFVLGVLAYVLLDYQRLYVETELRHLMRPTTDALVMAGPLFQPLRGLIFGVVFALIRGAWLGHPHGWARLWAVLVGLSILSTFGPSPGSIEGLIYTTLPLSLHVIGLPEVLLQSLFLSIIVFYWVRHPGTRWLRWLMWSAFGLVLALPALGLLVGRQ
jgi:hypothetical protein